VNNGEPVDQGEMAARLGKYSHPIRCIWEAPPNKTHLDDLPGLKSRVSPRTHRLKRKSSLHVPPWASGKFHDVLFLEKIWAVGKTKNQMETWSYWKNSNP